MSGIDPSRPFLPLNIAILTVSDSRSATQDRSGDLLAERIAEAGHHVAARQIVRDERAVIAAQLAAWCDDTGIDVVISTGGTGITGRDVTVEAHRDIYEKEIEAFATLFAMVSMESVGTSAMQSRATGGVARGTVLFALPGSTGACRDAWDRILRDQLDSRHGPCNLVALMPRLDEHQQG